MDLPPLGSFETQDGKGPCLITAPPASAPAVEVTSARPLPEVAEVTVMDLVEELESGVTVPPSVCAAGFEEVLVAKPPVEESELPVLEAVEADETALPAQCEPNKPNKVEEDETALPAQREPNKAPASRVSPTRMEPNVRPV